MKITVYTIKDCAFSKQEKEYLNANKLAYEEKDLETNKSFLTEMLAISNNFAGTPVTRVEKDDGSISVLKGFTKEEFDTTFGFTATPADNQSASSTIPGQINDTPIATKMSPKVEDIKPATEVVPPPVETIPPAPIPAPVEAPVTTTPDMSAGSSSKVSTAQEEEASAKADPLKSVIDNLQSKSEPAPTIPPVEQPVQSFDSTQDKPTTETSPPVNAPTIPDFPAK